MPPATLDDLHVAGLVLARAWPRGVDRLALEYRRPDGTLVVGQWMADTDRLARVAAGTPGAHLVTPRVLLQAHGADRRLGVLPGLVSEPGARLLVHRPERRAVVHRGTGSYVKVVRPGRAVALLTADSRARSTGAVAMPELLRADPDRGLLEWAAAPGRSLHDLLLDRTVDLGELRRAAAATGRAVGALHRADPPPGLATRDLHDKQLLVADADVTMIDVDTLARGEPALDLANLLVHVRLRSLQGAAPSRTGSATEALLEAYAPTVSVLTRTSAYALAVRARLVGLHSLRPGSGHVVTALLSDDGWPPRTSMPRSARTPAA